MKQTFNNFSFMLKGSSLVVMLCLFAQGIKAQFDFEKQYWMGNPPYITEKINMFISLDSTLQSISYNSLLTRDERDDIIQSRIDSDWVSTMASWVMNYYPNGMPPSEYPGWACGESSDQLVTNSHVWGNGILDYPQWNPPRLLYGGYYGFNLDTILMNVGTLKDMGKLGLPLYLVVIGEVPEWGTTGHAMNAVLTGDDITKWEGWNFIEPQFDQINVQPGQAYMPRNCGLVLIQYAYIRTRDDGRKQINSINIVKYSISNGIPILVKVNPYINDLLITKRENNPPVINVNNSAPDSLIWNIDEANFKGAWYSVNGNSKITIGQSGKINLLLPQGDYTMTMGAEDYFTLKSDTTFQRTIVNDSPVIKILSPVEGTVYDKDTNLQYDISDTDFDKAWYSVDGGKTKISIGQNGTVPLSLANGKYKLLVGATDKVLQTTKDSVTFEMKKPINEPPVITILSPLNGQVYGTDIQLKYKITDTDLKSASYTLNGKLTIPLGQSDTIPLLLPNGLYNIVLEAQDAIQTSKDSINFEMKKPVGIEPITLEDKVKIYPNPVNNYLYVRFGDITVDKLITEIYSADGTLQDTRVFQGGEEKRVGIERLSKGIYFLKITLYNTGGKTKTVTKKFVKE